MGFFEPGNVFPLTHFGMQFAEINFNCNLPLPLQLQLQLPHWLINGASDVPQRTDTCMCIRSAACLQGALAFDWLATRLDRRPPGEPT